MSVITLEQSGMLSSMTDPLGDRFSVSAGRITALILMELLLIDGVCAEEDGIVKLTLTFRARDDSWWSFSTLLGTRDFWFRKGAMAYRCERFVDPLFVFRAAIDYREDYRITVADGTELSGFLKLVPATFENKVVADMVQVRVTWKVRDHDVSSSVWASLCHNMVFNNILWRPTARRYSLFRDGAGPEYFIDLQKVNPTSGIDLETSEVQIRSIP